MNSLKVKDIIFDIAKELKITPQQVRDIVESPFTLLSEVMKSGDRETLNFENLFIMRFGTFGVKEGRKKHFAQINKKKRDEDKSID